LGKVVWLNKTDESLLVGLQMVTLGPEH
jgi:hypothetical protein